MSNAIVMADLNLESFVSAPTVEQLDACRKEDLLRVAEYFQISVSRQQLKRDIKRVVVQHLGEQGCWLWLIVHLALTLALLG